MKHGAPFRVMRFASPIGRAAAPAIVTVAYYAFTLAEALTWARDSIHQCPGRMWIQRPGRAASAVKLARRNFSARGDAKASWWPR